MFFNILHSNGDPGFALILAPKAQNGQKSPKTGGYPPFCTFFNVYIYNFFYGWRPRGQKVVFLTPNWEPDQKNMGLRGPTMGG